MRNVILFVQVSLDGFFEGPKKEIDWHMLDDELHAHLIEELKAMGAFLSGRVTYELMAGFWPTADADPDLAGHAQGGLFDLRAEERPPRARRGQSPRTQLAARPERVRHPLQRQEPGRWSAVVHGRG